MLVKPAYPSTPSLPELHQPQRLASAVGIQYWPFTGLVAGKARRRRDVANRVGVVGQSTLKLSVRDRSHIGFAFAERKRLRR